MWFLLPIRMVLLNLRGHTEVRVRVLRRPSPEAKHEAALSHVAEVSPFLPYIDPQLEHIINVPVKVVQDLLRLSFPASICRLIITSVGSERGALGATPMPPQKVVAIIARCGGSFSKQSSCQESRE